MYPGTWNIDFFFSADLAQTWSKRLQTEIFLISITILGYYKLLQSTSDIFYPILSTLKTAQRNLWLVTTLYKGSWFCSNFHCMLDMFCGYASLDVEEETRLLCFFWLWEGTSGCLGFLVKASAGIFDPFMWMTLMSISWIFTQGCR